MCSEVNAAQAKQNACRYSLACHLPGYYEISDSLKELIRLATKPSDIPVDERRKIYNAISRGCELEKTLVDLCKFVKIEPTVENYDKVLYVTHEYD